jgi:hypothetical protein
MNAAEISAMHEFPMSRIEKLHFAPILDFFGIGDGGTFLLWLIDMGTYTSIY